MRCTRRQIDAYVTEIITRISPEGITQRADLLIKDHRRLFLTRVPLQGSQREAVQVTDPWEYAELSECVEAWGFSAHAGKGVSSSAETRSPGAGSAMEFLPVVRMLRGADMLPEHTDAEAYLWIARERYRLCAAPHVERRDRGRTARIEHPESTSPLRRCSEANLAVRDLRVHELQQRTRFFLDGREGGLRLLRKQRSHPTRPSPLPASPSHIPPPSRAPGWRA